MSHAQLFMVVVLAAIGAGVGMGIVQALVIMRLAIEVIHGVSMPLHQIAQTLTRMAVAQAMEEERNQKRREYISSIS